MGFFCTVGLTMLILVLPTILYYFQYVWRLGGDSLSSLFVHFYLGSGLFKVYFLFYFSFFFLYFDSLKTVSTSKFVIFVHISLIYNFFIISITEQYFLLYLNVFIFKYIIFVLHNFYIKCV